MGRKTMKCHKKLVFSLIAAWITAAVVLIIIGTVKPVFAYTLVKSSVQKAAQSNTSKNSDNTSEGFTSSQEPAPAFKPYWKENKGKYYYRIQDGKWAAGITQIGDKKYYFDKKGVQHVGWQKIDKAYYYFRIAGGEKGYMVCSQKVNQIKLGKNGKAKISKANKKRLWVLAEAQRVVERATKRSLLMSKKEKLQASWKYILKNWRYVESPDYRYKKGWEVKNAYWCLESDRGDCMAQGAAFAFIGNACGYTGCCSVSSGGHGWAEVKGRVCDPTWAKVDKKHNYFMMKMSLSGKNRRPRYKTNRKHVYKI